MLKLNLTLHIKAKNIPINNGKNSAKQKLKLKINNNFLKISSNTIENIPIIQYLKNNLFCLEFNILKLIIKKFLKYEIIY